MQTKTIGKAQNKITKNANTIYKVARDLDRYNYSDLNKADVNVMQRRADKIAKHLEELNLLLREIRIEMEG